MEIIDYTNDGRDKQREAVFNELASACKKDPEKGEKLLETRLRDTESVAEFQKRSKPVFNESERILYEREQAHRKVYGGWTPPPKRQLA